MLAPVPHAPGLRLARPDDAPALRSLIRAAFHAAATPAYSPAVRDAMLTQGVIRLDEQLLHDGTLWVQVDGSGIVGCAGWTWRDQPYAMLPGTRGGERRPGIDPAEIRQVFVAPDHAGRGLGGLLLRRVEAEARSAGFATAELLATLNSVRFYTGQGWRVVGEHSLELADGSISRGLRMFKTLSAPRLAIV